MDRAPLPAFANKPETVMLNYQTSFEKNNLHPHIPKNGQINKAEKILSNFKHTRTGEVVYELTTMLGRESITYGVCNTTDLLIYLIENKHDILPKSWFDHPDKIRTVLGIAASHDIGIINGENIHLNGDKDLSTEELRTFPDAEKLKKLMNDLFSRISVAENGGTS